MSDGASCSPLRLMSLPPVLSNFALTWWQEEKWGRSQGFYSGLYAALGIASAFSTFLMGGASVWLGTSASISLHSGAIKSVSSCTQTSCLLALKPSLADPSRAAVLLRHDTSRPDSEQVVKRRRLDRQPLERRYENVTSYLRAE